MPLAVVAKIKNALRVVAVDAVAEQRGIRLGTSLADARGAVPDLVVAEADEAADRALLEQARRLGATAIRRSSRSIRRMASSSTFPAARISSPRR